MRVVHTASSTRKFPDQDKQVVDNELGILGNAYREDEPDLSPL
jgi:hypothetical protein